MLDCCTVNQRMPLWSKFSVCGSFAFGSGNGYSVTRPVSGSSLPISAALLPVNQILPDLSSARPCGPVNADFRVYSRIAPVLGSTRPSLLTSWPVHQIEPSRAASGSCGREPWVGTSHIVMIGFHRAVDDGRRRARPFGKILDQVVGHGAPLFRGEPARACSASSARRFASLRGYSRREHG